MRPDVGVCAAWPAPATLLPATAEQPSYGSSCGLRAPIRHAPSGSPIVDGHGRRSAATASPPGQGQSQWVGSAGSGQGGGVRGTMVECPALSSLSDDNPCLRDLAAAAHGRPGQGRGDPRTAASMVVLKRQHGGVRPRSTFDHRALSSAQDGGAVRSWMRACIRGRMSEVARSTEVASTSALSLRWGTWASLSRKAMAPLYVWVTAP